MKLYDLIRQLLINRASLRYNDKELMWTIWKDQGMVYKDTISYGDFVKAEDPETIRRTRQKVQEDHPEVGRKGVSAKEKQGKYFVYHEKVAVFDNTSNTVRFE